MLDALMDALGEEVEDADEETFLLYAQPSTSQNLGFVDPKASEVEVVVAGRDYVIHQSPGVLASSRAGGTTGAVLWKIAPLFADWLSSPTNILFTSRALCQTSILLELGCGISPLNALALVPSRVASYVLTDQSYVQRLVRLNISENGAVKGKTAGGSSKKGHGGKGGGGKGRGGGQGGDGIHFTILDWESDQVTPSLTSCSTPSFDAVIACDCVFNYALIKPFVQTCVDACKLRSTTINNINININTSTSTNSNTHATSSTTANPPDSQQQPCLCVVAQQLRNDDVFNSWLQAFCHSFRVWRVPDGALPAELRPEAGFVVHVGVLRDGA